VQGLNWPCKCRQMDSILPTFGEGIWQISYQLKRNLFRRCRIGRNTQLFLSLWSLYRMISHPRISLALTRPILYICRLNPFKTQIRRFLRDHGSHNRDTKSLSLSKLILCSLTLPSSLTTITQRNTSQLAIHPRVSSQEVPGLLLHHYLSGLIILWNMRQLHKYLPCLGSVDCTTKWMFISWALFT
jgi:hypothetical protein